MDATFWMQLVLAGLLGFMIIRMIPAARHWLKNGPRGSSNDWLTFSFLIGGVVLFVLVLMMLV